MDGAWRSLVARCFGSYRISKPKAFQKLEIDNLLKSIYRALARFNNADVITTIKKYYYEKISENEIMILHVVTCFALINILLCIDI